MLSAFVRAWVLASVLAACSGDQATQRASDTIYRVNDDELSSLDPHKISTVIDTRVARDMFEGLTDYAADGSIVPGLAESWTVDASGLKWTFKLRPNTEFSDQTPINARSVVYSMQRLFTPVVAAPNASLLFAIRNAEAVTKGELPVSAIGVEAVDNATVRITLGRPFPALPELLAHACSVVLPEHVIRTHGDSWSKPENIVVSGAFLPTSWALHSQLKLSKNSHYWNARKVSLQHAIYLPISEDQTALRKFRAHEVDVVTDFPTGRLEGLRKRHGTDVRIDPYRGTYYYVFNTRKKPFDDRRVRLALNMATDRDIITKLVLPLGMRPAYSVVPPGIAGYGDPVVPAWAQWPMARRRAEARRLLAAAGIDPAHPHSFEVRYNSDDDHRRVALALAAMWKPLGVRPVLFNSEASVHFSNLRAHTYLIGRSGWIADFSGAENFLGLYASNAGRLNYTGYANKSFDRALTAALAIADVPLRNQALRQAETVMLEDMPILPLYFYVSKTLVSKDVAGWQAAPSGVHLSKYLKVTRDEIPQSKSGRT
jgi:oligopeptide transport system substrate-binding protein